MNAIEIKNLHFSYGKENVLDGVSLCLKEGRLAILAGENGAGKSTLLRLLLGELPIGENPKGDQEEGSGDGSIEILGQDIRQFKDWSSISYVPQNGMGGWKDFPASVEEIVRANLYKQIGLFRFAGKKERQQVRAALAQVGMEEYQNRLIGRLSGGQQQRVLLARALVNEPKLLILDEPTAGLDPKGRDEILDQIAYLHKESDLTVILVSHSMEDIARYADRLIVMNSGEVMYNDTPKNVFAHYQELEKVGLAAPQVGILKRIVVIDVGEGPVVMVNPVILETSGEQTGDEGCLSIPGKAGQVTRPNYVKVHAFDENMEEYEIEGTELMARAMCHEIDHLDGHLYVEKVEGQLHDVTYEEEE